MPGDPTPCSTCPRGSPTREEETTLSDRNWKAYARYLEVDATKGMCLVGAQRTDPLALRVMRTIHVIVQDCKAAAHTNAIVEAIAASAGLRV